MNTVSFCYRITKFNYSEKDSFSKSLVKIPFMPIAAFAPSNFQIWMILSSLESSILRDSGGMQRFGNCLSRFLEKGFQQYIKAFFMEFFK